MPMTADIAKSCSYIGALQSSILKMERAIHFSHFEPNIFTFGRKVTVSNDFTGAGHDWSHGSL